MGCMATSKVALPQALRFPEKLGNNQNLNEEDQYANRDIVVQVTTYDILLRSYKGER